MRNWLAPGEQVIVITRAHGRQLFWPAVVFIFAPAVTAVVLAWLSRAKWTQLEFWRPWAQLGIIALCVLILLAFCLRKYFAWLATRYVLTSQRFAVKTGLLVRSQRDIPLASVRTVSIRQGIVQRMQRCGRINLVMGSEEATQVRDVPEVSRMKDLILEAIRQIPEPFPAQVAGMNFPPQNLSTPQISLGRHGRY